MASWHIAEILRRCNIAFVEEEMEVNNERVNACRAFLSGGPCSIVLHSMNTPSEDVLWNRLREFHLV